MQTVLLIDDSPTIRYLLKVYLTGMAVKVVEANDGKEGLAVVRGGGIALVIADLRMPVLNGFEFIEKVRADGRYAGLPVVLLTMDESPGLREEALRLGANEFLIKPVALNVLRETVLRWLPVPATLDRT